MHICFAPIIPLGTKGAFYNIKHIMRITQSELALDSSSNHLQLGGFSAVELASLLNGRRQTDGNYIKEKEEIS